MKKSSIGSCLNLIFRERSHFLLGDEPKSACRICLLHHSNLRRASSIIYRAAALAAFLVDVQMWNNLFPNHIC